MAQALDCYSAPCCHLVSFEPLEFPGRPPFLVWLLKRSLASPRGCLRIPMGCCPSPLSISGLDVDNLAPLQCARASFVSARPNFGQASSIASVSVGSGDRRSRLLRERRRPTPGYHHQPCNRSPLRISRTETIQREPVTRRAWGPPRRGLDPVVRAVFVVSPHAIWRRRASSPKCTSSQLIAPRRSTPRATCDESDDSAAVAVAIVAEEDPRRCCRHR